MNNSNFTCEETYIEDCKIYSLKRFIDHRGYFSELYSMPFYHNKISQINSSFSYKNVLRGIHEATFGKLVSCVQGRIFDVCVDLRKTSSSYLKVFCAELSEKNGKQLYIPPNCGHAFYALEDSVVVYGQTDIYSKLKEKTHCYKNFDIPWPNVKKVILSDKDKC